MIAVSAAACSVGVTIVHCTRSAARAGALEACILIVPVLSTAAFLMRDQREKKQARGDASMLTNLVSCALFFCFFFGV